VITDVSEAPTVPVFTVIVPPMRMKRIGFHSSEDLNRNRNFLGSLHSKTDKWLPMFLNILLLSSSTEVPTLKMEVPSKCW
jgi:hypothetical protein